MAANFWTSSHCNHWLLSRQKLQEAQEEDLKYISEKELRCLRMFYLTFIQQVAKANSLRQQVVATAIIYFRRFYTKNSFRSCDPLLVGPTCLYLACKVEECSVITASTLVAKLNQEVENLPFKPYQYRTEAILECEFYLLEELDCYMVVYHPYRPLAQYVSELGLDKNAMQTAWNIVNDSYQTDVCLLYPPYLIAFAAIYMTVVMKDEDTRASSNSNALTEPHKKSDWTKDASHLQVWFAELNVDFEEIIEVTQELLNFYAFNTQQSKEKSFRLSETVAKIRAGLPL